MVWLSLHRGTPVNVPIGRTAHCFHLIPANDIKDSMFGHRKLPRLSLGSIPVPLALEASALTTELPEIRVFIHLCYGIKVCVLLTGKHKVK